MSQATATVYESTVHETKARSPERARRVLEATRAKPAASALLDYELSPNHPLHTLDLIGAESVFFFDTWAL
jgi:hypothetical protein